MLPSPERFHASAEATGLAVGEPMFFGESYARTLTEWRARFESTLPQVRALGYDERFIRLWRYYLAYCRAGFDAKTVDVMQVRLDV
jgi:cyclopropane-fatty-acyl-phospholipid synthase